MRLEAWMERQGMTPDSLAKKLGITDVAVRRYMRDQRRPEPRALAEIVRLSKGEVGPEDFYPECARLLARFRAPRSA